MIVSPGHPRPSAVCSPSLARCARRGLVLLGLVACCVPSTVSAQLIFAPGDATTLEATLQPVELPPDREPVPVDGAELPIVRPLPGELAPGETTELTIDATTSARVIRNADGTYSGEIVTREGDAAPQTEDIVAENTLEFSRMYIDVARAVRREQLKKFLMERAAANGPRPVASRIISNVSDGKRELKVESQDESITISDTDGKQISIRRVWKDAAGQHEETYAADDLAQLQAKHPAGARLYEKLVPATVAPIANGQGVVIINRLNPKHAMIVGGAAPMVAPAAALPNASPVPVVAGPRTIRARYQGADLEIRDNDGADIFIKLVSPEPGGAIQAAEAASYVELLDKSPTLAKLYAQYAGLPASED